MDRFSDGELAGAEILCRSNEVLNANVPERLRAISQHEQNHVAALSAVVEALGGDPSRRFEFTFLYETPRDFLQIAQILDNTGVSAYDGPISFVGTDLPPIGSTLLQTAGATIVTLET